MKRLVEGSFNTQKLINRISEAVENVRPLYEELEPDQALEGLKAVDKSLRDKFDRLEIATRPLETHANILVAYLNIRLTRELAKQSRTLTWATIVLTVATVFLALPIIIQLFLWFLK
ncbi:MAG: hypothetical protein FJ358_03285 [Thaumarchaeota archaeon]|nr:hypothetical protein [Nitrososphaerota archaeon]